MFDGFLVSGSINAVTTWLNDQGFTTTNGNPWDKASVRKMLKNPRYAAIRVHRGQEYGQGNWPALVPEEVVRAAQALLSDPTRRHSYGVARKWLGASFYLCGRCAENKMRHVMPSWYTGKKVRTYRCEHCGATRKAQPVDDYVEKVMVARLRRDDLVDLLAKQAPDVKPLRTEARALEIRLEALADNIELDEKTLARRTNAIRARLDELGEALATAGRKSALASIVGARDPGQAWLDLPDIGTRQAVMRELATITLRQAVSRGPKPFEADSVIIDFHNPNA